MLIKEAKLKNKLLDIVNDIVNVSCIISLLCLGFVLFNNTFLWFSFTEGWYSTWANSGTLSEIYESGFPFPPTYLFCYKIILNLIDTISIDRYLGLRICGIFLSFLNLFVLYKTLRNLGNNSNFSLLVSSTALIIFHSMEAFLTYDYTPFNGFFVPNSSLRDISPGISDSAISISFLPQSAREMSLIL